MSIHYQGQLTKDEIRQALIIHHKASKSSIMMHLLLSAAIIGFAIGRIRHSIPLSFPDKLLLSFLFFMALYVIIKPLIAPYTSLSKFAKDKDLQAPLSGEITDKGVTIKALRSYSEIDWDVYQTYKKTDDLILIYQENNWFNFFPKSFFNSNEDWELFLKLVEEKLPN